MDGWIACKVTDVRHRQDLWEPCKIFKLKFKQFVKVFLLSFYQLEFSDGNRMEFWGKDRSSF